jgi:thioredoxin reductase
MYKIKKAQPFIIEGQNGKYMIPAFSTLSTEDMEGILSLTPETPTAERMQVMKKFLLRFAPGLETEELGDIGYSQIFAAYEKEQNLGER